MLLIRAWSLFIAAIIAVPVPTINYRRVAEKDLQYSVLLRMKGTYTTKKGEKKAALAGCSGTYIAPTKILTAAHCVQGFDIEKVWARGPENALGYQVKVIKYDAGRDLALLESAFPHKYAAIGPYPEVGDEVLNIGSPLAFEFVASQGIISVLRFTARPFTGTYIVTTAMIDHGSSGGGVFNKKGQLIGVNTLSVGLFGWGGLALAVDVATIRGFLNDR